MTVEIATIARMHLKPGLIFGRCVDFLIQRRVQVPRAGIPLELIRSGLQARKTELIAAINHFKAAEGNIGTRAPTGLLGADPCGRGSFEGCPEAPTGVSPKLPIEHRLAIDRRIRNPKTPEWIQTASITIGRFGQTSTRLSPSSECKTTSGWNVSGGTRG